MKIGNKNHENFNITIWIIYFNECPRTSKVPKQWLKVKIIALLKPEKITNDVKNFRSISLLCHLYKLYERLISNKIAPVEKPNKISSWISTRKTHQSNTKSYTKHWRWFRNKQKKKITGAIFVDLTPAYYTVNHNLLLENIHKTIKNLIKVPYHLIKVDEPQKKI